MFDCNLHRFIDPQAICECGRFYVDLIQKKLRDSGYYDDVTSPYKTSEEVNYFFVNEVPFSLCPSRLLLTN